MTDEQRKWLIAGGLVLMMILVFLIGYVLGGMIEKNSTKQSELTVLATPTVLTSTSNQATFKIFLPLIIKQLLTPTVVLPVETPKPTSDVWIVIKIEKGALKQNGFVYDVDTFENKTNKSVTLRAHCAEPGWPAPKIGDEYRLNSAGVLIPVKDSNMNPFQRFIVLDD